MHVHHDRPYRFCPHCGGELELRSLKSTEPDRLVCARCGFVFYVDPKVAVGTIIEDAGGRIVLVRRAIEPGYGKWVFPGGYVDRGEEVHLAAVREFSHVVTAAQTVDEWVTAIERRRDDRTATGQILVQFQRIHAP